MMTSTILRLGALAAILSVIGQVTWVALSPNLSGPPDVGASTVLAAADTWKALVAIRLAGILFVVPAVTVVIRTLDRTEGGEWSRLCLPLAIVAATLGSAVALIGGSVVNLADAASEATPAAKAGYLAAFDAISGASDFLDFGALVALGMTIAVLARAILVSHVYARAIGWLCAGAGVLMLTGLVLELADAETGLLVYAGFLLFVIAFIALAVSMWRQAARVGRAAVAVAPSGLDPATATH